ncbi:MAG: hypothetical protein ACD_28C00353G0002 [uncultured bacterium]|nr:MAG: hypothetical protein ACD_28C00353G0002 [uncultured bacterium]
MNPGTPSLPPLFSRENHEINPKLSRKPSLVSLVQQKFKGKALALIFMLAMVGCKDPYHTDQPPEQNPLCDPFAPAAPPLINPVASPSLSTIPSTAQAILPPTLLSLAPSKFTPHALTPTKKPEKLHSLLVGRQKTNGTYSLFARADGVLWADIPRHPHWYEELQFFYPQLEETIENQTPLRALPMFLKWWGKEDDILKWRVHEDQRVQYERETVFVKVMQYCLQDQSLSVKNSQVTSFKIPIPDQKNLDHPNSSTIRYEANPEDDIQTFLRLVLDPRFYNSLEEIAIFVELLSGPSEWNIPLVYLNAREHFGWEAREIQINGVKAQHQLRQAEIKLKDKKLKKATLQPAQQDYHQKNKFPVFTDENQEELVERGLEKKRLVHVIPQTEDYFRVGKIYTQDPFRESLACYTTNETFRLVEAMGRYVNKTLHEAYGLAAEYEVFLILNALGRTVEYQETKLKTISGNGTATDRKKGLKKEEFVNLSSHCYYSAADIATTRVIVKSVRYPGVEYELTEQQHRALLQGVQATLLEFFVRQAQAGKAMGGLEKGSQKLPSPHLHMVGMREN